jgi:hypothetical protein
MPEGNVELQPVNPFENVGAGKPVAVAWKLPAVPTVNVVELALVTTGSWSTVSVKVWVTVPTAFVAVKHRV